ncbi:hypothetical protein BsWGS_13166 [Bradybaena similaris]
MFNQATFVLLLAAIVGTALTQVTDDCPKYKCTKDISRVCGTDLVTYDNRCMMLSQNCGEDILAYTGECRERAPCDIYVKCSSDLEPVCGNDGNTYRNSCYMFSNRCREVEVAYQGEC